MTTQAPEREHSQDELVYGLPAWTYQNAELLDLEYQRLILGTWQVVCHANDVPDPGDYTTLELMRDSIIVLRGRDGDLRAFHNVCRHRGARLVDGPGKCRSRLVCPYHGWAYRLDGSLAGVPSEKSFPGLDKSCHGLNEVELEVLLGFVFVRVAGEGPSLKDMWGDYVKTVAPYEPEKMVALTEVVEEEWDADWKTVVDNNQENYHIPLGHPGYYRMLDSDMLGFSNEHGVGASISVHRTRPSSNWVERSYQELAPEALTHLPEKERKTWQFFSMLPNHGIDIYPDSMDFFQILPVAPGRSRIRWGQFGKPDKSRKVNVLRYLNRRINRQVMSEDRDLSERVQFGLGAHGYEPGPLSIYETGVREFHDLIRETIPVTKLDTAPVPGALAEIDAQMLDQEDEGGPGDTTPPAPFPVSDAAE